MIRHPGEGRRGNSRLNGETDLVRKTELSRAVSSQRAAHDLMQEGIQHICGASTRSPECVEIEGDDMPAQDWKWSVGLSIKSIAQSLRVGA